MGSTPTEELERSFPDSEAQEVLRNACVRTRPAPAPLGHCPHHLGPDTPGEPGPVRT